MPLSAGPWGHHGQECREVARCPEGRPGAWSRRRVPVLVATGEDAPITDDAEIDSGPMKFLPRQARRRDATHEPGQNPTLMSSAAKLDAESKRPRGTVDILSLLPPRGQPTASHHSSQIDAADGQEHRPRSSRCPAGYASRRNHQIRVASIGWTLSPALCAARNCRSTKDGRQYECKDDKVFRCRGARAKLTFAHSRPPESKAPIPSLFPEGPPEGVGATHPGWATETFSSNRGDVNDRGAAGIRFARRWSRFVRCSDRPIEQARRSDEALSPRRLRPHHAEFQHRARLPRMASLQLLPGSRSRGFDRRAWRAGTKNRRIAEIAVERARWQDFPFRVAHSSRSRHDRD